MQFKKIGHLISTVHALPESILRNLRGARRLRPFPVSRFGTYCIEPLTLSRLSDALCLFEKLNNKRLGRDKKMLLALMGPKLALVVRDERNDVLVGLAYYYFNQRDAREGTIHVGYSGLVETARGCGLGTYLRKHALNTFAVAGLKGVSTRVSASNRASWRVNEKLGFVVVETYFDDPTREVRHYMVCELQRFRNDPIQD